MFFIIATIIIIIILLVVLLLYYSKIEIEIKNLDISTLREKEHRINENYEIIIALVIVKKWKIIKRKMTKAKIGNIKSLKKIKDLDIEFIKNKKSNIKFKNIISDLKLEINKLDFYLEIGVEDAALTAISVGIVSSILGVFLRNKITVKDKFEIKPIYIQKNLINLKLNCIFQIQLVKFIHDFFKKEKLIKINS